tara:strand:+ start:7443 stop:8117 length:675 start_codon:yes stop_codon:yes gene_type:complete
MKTILICGYRDWSYDLYKLLETYSHLDFKDKQLIYHSEADELESVVYKYNPEMIFFIGWSWIIDENIIEKYKCICLHPSPLPKYRGGSPLQHQIMNGETESAVTLFEMDNGIDTGDILFQKTISLEGNLSDIFIRIVNVGCIGIREIVNGDYEVVKQDESKATFFKRRTPKMSEITFEEISDNTAEYLYNKIRALQSPYPNAFIKCKDGTKLFLEHASVEGIKK